VAVFGRCDRYEAFILYYGRSVDPTGVNSTGGVYRSAVHSPQRPVAPVHALNCRFEPPLCVCALLQMARNKAVSRRIPPEVVSSVQPEARRPTPRAQRPMP